MNRKGDELYSAILEQVTRTMLGTGSTSMSQLSSVGDELLGKRFQGVFASDQIPVLKRPGYAIVNTDPWGSPGEHWIAIARGKTGNTWVYDSFGRPTDRVLKSMLKSGNGDIQDTERDSEQLVREEDCGARSMAWLLVFDRFGAKKAAQV